MKILRCPNGHYTTKKICHCGEKAKSAHPPKYSEKHGKYRRAAKEKKVPKVLQSAKTILLAVKKRAFNHFGHTASMYQDRLLLSDWNGTLTSSTEEASNKRIGYTMLADAKSDIKKGHLSAFGTLGRLLLAKKRTEKALAAYKEGRAQLADVYRPFNIALRGNDPSYIYGIIDDFAGDTADRVDPKMLGTFRNLHRSTRNGIVSVAYDRVIRATLRESGFQNVFDYVVANELGTKGNKVTGLSLDIYGKKAEVVENEFFRIKGFDPKKAVYTGDTVDDAPVADLLPKGHFVVPFLASKEFAEKMAGEGAFVPENEQNLEKYLRSLLSISD